MSKIEQAKAYAGRELETIFFRPMLTGPGAEQLGIRIMYNMPVPTTLQFWRRAGDVLQKYAAAGWLGGAPADRFQKTIHLYKVKAEVGYSAEDYFNSVFELITNRSEVNLDDLSGTELEEAETTLFRQAIAESIRATLWLGDTSRAEGFNTFDGLLTRIMADLSPDPAGAADKPADAESLAYGSNIFTYGPLTGSAAAPGAATELLKRLWRDASPVLKEFKGQGNLAYFVTSDVFDAYEDELDAPLLESAYLARQEGRSGLSYRGIPVIDVQLAAYLPQCPDLPQSFALLTDRRNLALAVNTSEFPGSEVRMWYNPDQMENRQRAVFMAGCDYLLPELVAFAVPENDPSLAAAVSDRAVANSSVATPAGGNAALKTSGDCSVSKTPGDAAAGQTPIR